MEKLLKISINRFSESDEFEEFFNDGELDVEGIVAKYSGEAETNEEESIEEGISEETELDEGEEEVSVQETEDSPMEQEKEKPEKRTPDQAFAEMRRQVEKYEPLAKWVEQLAIQQGFSNPKELIDAFEKQRLAREAEEKGVPVDVYERLNRLEQENKAKEEALIAERFNNEVETTKEKYKLTDEQINEVFRFMGQNHYISEQGHPLIPFEHAYVLANKDNLIQQAEERGRQSYLEEKRKQQQQATPSVETHSNDKQNEDELDYSKEAIFETLKKHDIYF